ncbi:cyclic peptide transporter [Nonlabens dokdonensis DSW-6]|uniref:Cyclic peptide transporter n=2 Tax=Nonlabens dokdonensis TaxID=328515 RepID=L7W675_NONDD|nr:cyclic peptide transporter [Nonlabens dokdonensis DSW-6]
MHQFDGILSGNKEIKVNREKGEEIFSKGVYPLLKRGKEKNIVAYIGYLNSQLISQVLFYIIVIFILLFVGDFFDVSLGTSISFVFALLFLFSPIVTIMLAIPPLNQGLISYNKLKDLKKKLEYEEFNNSYLNSNNDSPKVFKQVRFENCFYQYLDTSFEVGPFDLTINANEIIFVYGGNGAGKTTFIYMLLNLFTPDKGSIYFKDDEPESSEKVSQLFSPVFSDFYLFDDFYGIKNFDLEKVSSLLKLFELHDKVKIKEGKFSTLDLSAGQRKRLALIVAVLEDRPILVLDEWAADQDPYFRKKFYTEIIHKIVQEENKTIIAITHDDNYYQEADRLFKMDYGKLEEINSENTLQTKNNILT